MTRMERKKRNPNQRNAAYEYYMLKQIREKTPMVLRLANGEEVSGSITWYDKYVIKLEREPEAPNLLIQKQDIVYYYKDEKGISESWIYQSFCVNTLSSHS
jgi:sRNA-binding regulator protein Hfq